MIEYHKNLSLESLFYIDEKGLVCLEEWREVIGFEGFYQVSDLGRIKSLKRKFLKNGIYPSFIKEKILKTGRLNPKSYSQTSFYNNGVHFKLSVHLLVAQAFYNHNPNKDLRIVVDHKNNIKRDNRLFNLQLITHRENVSKDLKNKTSKYTGVCYRKKSKRWRSIIYIGFDCVEIGTYADELCAKKLYETAVKVQGQYNGDKLKFRELVKSLC